jgi:hypothetical protein
VLRILGLIVTFTLMLWASVSSAEAARPTTDVVQTHLEWDLPGENWDCGIDVHVENNSMSVVTKDPRRGTEKISYNSTTTYENVATGTVVTFRNIGRETKDYRQSPRQLYSHQTVSGVQSIRGPDGFEIAAGRSTFALIITYDDQGNVEDVWTERTSRSTSDSQPFDELCDFLQHDAPPDSRVRYFRYQANDELL